jgi:hypothetical protein
MIASRDVICGVCKEAVSILGMAAHVKKHGLTYRGYKNKYHEKKYCEFCDNPVEPPRKFCSIGCANKAKFKGGRPEGKLSSLEIYRGLSVAQKKAMVDYYLNEATNRNMVCLKFSVPLDTVVMVTKEFNVKLHSRSDGLKRKKAENIQEFMKTSLGLQLIEEYKNPECSLKKLEKKYRIGKMVLSLYFTTVGIKIRAKEESLSAVRQYNRLNDIRGVRYGKPAIPGSGKCSWYFHDGIKYQGSWEFRMGLWLKSQGIDFKCHVGVRQFEYARDGQTFTYCPDFYIPDGDYFIEVKGYFSKEDRKKIETIRRYYPDVRLDVYEKEKLVEKGILTIDQWMGIHIEDYAINYRNNEYLLEKFESSVDWGKLFHENFVEKKNLLKLSKQYDVLYSIMCRAFYKKVPKAGTPELIQFLFNTFFTEEDIKKIDQLSIAGAARSINNGLPYKRIYQIVDAYKKCREPFSKLRLVKCL